MDTQLQRIQAALAGRYEVEHELGRGGMAVVYLGRDPRLGRRVAIKVFEPEGGHSQGSERFLREIRVAAQLQHPNILAVHESGEADGLIYYVMPYIAGASLRERIEREGALPIQEAVRIAREVAAGLDHAHRANVVHRDIKPDNIMLADGVAVVADFGIARAVEEAGAGTLTETGLAIGTAAYMSPEQATASPNVDGRSDIYALGCVLYEMLSGGPPFNGETQAVMVQHITAPVPPLGKALDVPTSLEAIVLKALAKAPDDRWPTGRVFAEMLADAVPRESVIRPVQPPDWWRRHRRFVWAAGALAVAFGGWLTWSLLRPKPAEAASITSVRSLAVLPVTVSGDTTRASLAEGLMEDLITGLWRIEGLRVPASGQVLALRDRGDPRSIGRALDVAAVISTAVQVSGNSFHVTAALTRVSDGFQLWRYQINGEWLVHGELRDLLAVQGEITQQLVDTLKVQLSASGRAALARGPSTHDPRAYELYLQGRRAVYELTRAGVSRGIGLLEQALRRDSTFADAWVALADAYDFYAQFDGLPPADVSARLRTAVERAIELDSLNGYAFAMRAQQRLVSDWDHRGARRDLQRALQLSPGSAEVERTYALLLNVFNEPDSALAHMRRSVSLDPLNSFAWSGLSIRFNYLGWADSAAAAAQYGVSLDSTNWVAHMELARAYRRTGRPEAAERETDAVLRFSGGSLPLALALVASTQPGRAHQMLNRLMTLSRRQYVQAIYLAMARLAAGDRAGALDDLEESARNHDFDLLWFLDGLEGLRADARYQAVRQRVLRDIPPPRRS